jgi:cytochrome c peroxidase
MNFRRLLKNGFSRPNNFHHIILLIALAWLPMAAPAQTNSISTSTNAPSAAAQVWDYADELDFSAEQRAAMEKIHAAYDAARSELRQSNQADAPPDVKQAARETYAEKFREINRQVGALLTEDQKEKLADLRATKSAAPRRAVRPTLSDEEYKKFADGLRAAYSQPTTNWPAPTIDDEVKPRYVELGLLPPVIYPTNNLFSSAKAGLGKKLFFDPRLSGSGQIACASCHDPDLAWADGRTVSFGHSRKELKRNAPAILNAGQLHALFWDGRASSLERQVRDVVSNEDEMRSGDESVKKTLGNLSGYTNEFAAVFGTPEVSLARAAQAIATFERTIISRPSLFDAFLRGDTNALNDSAIRGLNLFRTTARCANCHFGPNLSDGLFHNEGLSYYGRKLQDLGRYEVTKQAEDVGAFKTPSLRNISRTAPYMHNGLFDLDGVLNLYNAGMPTLRRNAKQENDPLFPTKSKLLQPLGLNKQDLADLKAFLDSLTELRTRVRPPELPTATASTTP